MRPSPRPVPRLLQSAALVLAAALMAAGCGAEKENKADRTPSPTTPTPSVQVPSGVTLTDAGAKLKFGETATVPYQPNERRGSVLAITVVGVTRARIQDFSSYVLDTGTKASTPYFVRVKVANVGSGDVGRTDVPLWAVDQDNTLIHSSSFTNTYRRCPSAALPATFGPHMSASTCLVYLVPNHGLLTAMSFRPLQAFEPIVWSGAIVTEKAPPSKKHGKNGKKRS